MTTGQLINLLKEMPEEEVYAIPTETATDDETADYARYIIKGVIRDDKFSNVCIMCYVDETSEPIAQGTRSAPRRNLERDRNEQNRVTPEAPPEQIQSHHKNVYHGHDVGSQTIDEMKKEKEKHKKDEDEKKVPKK